MTGNHLKPKTPETARRYEWKLQKAPAIIGMILCNPVIRLGIRNPDMKPRFPISSVKLSSEIISALTMRSCSRWASVSLNT